MVEPTRTTSLATSLAALTLIALAALIGPDIAQAENPITEFKAGPSETQAGGHPDIKMEMLWGDRLHIQEPCGCSDVKSLFTHLPTGVIGDPHSAPICSLVEFSQNECPVGSQVGWVTLKVLNILNLIAPVYNMQPHPDEAGSLGFFIPVFNAAAFIRLSSRTGSDYGLDASAEGFWHALPASGLTLDLWGVPASSKHDVERSFFGGAQEICLESNFPQGCPLGAKSDAPLAPYLQNPTTCGEGLSIKVDVASYDGGVSHAEAPWPATTGCQQLAFDPSLTAEPTTGAADSPSGLEVDLSVPQTQSATVPSPSELRATTVTFPDGFSINPNAADGKVACSNAQANFGTELPAACPDDAKVGTIEIDSSALPGPLPGGIYLGEPQAGNKYRLILTGDGFGTHVKLAGTVHASPQNGRLVVAFDQQPGQGEPMGLPQTPLQEFKFHFFGSERGLLATPPQCGEYPVRGEFTPWDGVLPAQTSLSSFTISSGPNGTPCPGTTRPFNPTLAAGDADNTAGAHTPFSLQLSRVDGDQNLTALNVTAPPGFAATLAGIPYCPAPALAKLAQVGYSGLREQASPACPAASQVGTALAATGAGTHPLYSPGRVYLAGPYKGAPLSLEVVVPAVSGPYDLGNVVVRSAVFVNPVTAQVSTVSDPIAQILEGIPLRLRSILINLDRPGFTVNGTDCSPFSVQTQAFGNQGAVADLSAHMQYANCAAMPFSPKLGLKFSGSNKRRGHPALRAVLTMKPGNANLQATTVVMPSNEQLDQSHIKTVCTRVQFAAGTCPHDSIYGHATLFTPLLEQPLSGPVVLRSSSHKLPDLVADLEGQIHLEISGRIDSPKQGGLRTRFESLPDAPFTKFVLDMQGGAKGLLVNSSNVCSTSRTATVKLVGQNGKRLEPNTKLQASCGSGKSKSGHHRIPRHPRGAR